MEKTTSIMKFKINEQSYYVKIIWKPNANDLFHIKIYDGDTTWSGRFSYEFAKKYRERFEETEEQYYSSVKIGLQKDHEFAYSFVLQPNEKDSAVFSWKKKFEDSTHGCALMVHGSVPIHRDATNESKDILLDFLLAENQDLRDAIDMLNAKNDELTLDLNDCKNDLDKFVDIKTSLERSLYGKFIHLLSAKKRRIQLLEENLNEVKKSNNPLGDELD